MAIFFMQILNMSMTASVVILCVMAARLLLKRSPKIFSYALWAVVLFRLLCPISLTAPVSILEVTQPQVAEISGVSTVVYEPIEYIAVESGDIGSPVQREPISVQELQQEQKDTKPTVLEAASYIWLAGIAVMVLYSLVTYLRLYRNLVSAVRLRGNVYLADHIASPFVLGTLFPKIYLPSDTPMKERRYILAHERHHIRRGDHIIKLAAYVALCIHWFNPLVWIAFVLAGKDMEMSCDEAVIKKLGEHVRADYSASLLRLATGRRLIAGTPLSFGEGDPKGRIRNMAKWKKPKVWVSILCVVICLAIAAVCVFNPKEKQELGELTRISGPADIGIGDLRFILPEGMTQENIDEQTSSTSLYNSIFTDGTKVIGGVDIYDSPDFALNSGSSEGENNYAEWVAALGLPEVQGDLSITGMMGDTNYGNLEAEYWNAQNPEKFDVKHYFYIHGAVVYDIWCDLNLVTVTEMADLLETVYLENQTERPEDTATSTAETVADAPSDPLARCAQVLQSLQDRPYYQIITHKQKAGEVQNSANIIQDWKFGDDWMHINSIPESNGYSALAYMYRDGVHYNNESTAGVDANGNILWNTCGNQEHAEPWLATFRWNTEKIELLSTEESVNSTIVHLAVNEPLEHGDAVAEHYTVDFVFNYGWNFRKAVLTAKFTDEEGTFDIVDTMIISGHGPEDVAADMDVYFYGTDPVPKEAVAITVQGRTIAYDELTVTIPDGYSYRQTDDGVILTKDGQDIGGITHWTKPDAILTDTIAWIRALGIPEAQQNSLAPIAYMIDGSGELRTAWFGDEFYPEKLNREHNLFQIILTDNDIVYDIWFDKNRISDIHAEKFLKTVYLAGEPTVVTQVDDGTESLAKCKAVLEAVQSGSYHITLLGENYGDTGLQSSYSTEISVNGDDWLSITTILTEGTDIADSTEDSIQNSALYVNGKRFAYTGTEWVEIAPNDSFHTPWLAEFQWEEELVTYVDTLTSNGDTVVMLRIDEPWPGLEEYRECYWVNFYFDPNGSFIKAKLQTDYIIEEEDYAYYSIINTESIVTLAPAAVADEIDKEYQRAIG